MNDLREPSGDQYATWDAAYVLGALSAAERREFEGHLSGCEPCRRAVDDLADMPALLSQLTRPDVEAIDADTGLDDELPGPRPELLDALLDTVGRRRRRARMLTWAGGLAAAAAVAIGLLVAIRPSPVPSAPPQASGGSILTMAPVTPSALTATAQLVGHSWGTDIELNCTYAEEAAGSGQQDADNLAMVAVGRDGSHTRLATWLAQPGVAVSTTGSVSLPVDEIASVQVVSADTGEVLLQTRAPN
jgi:hypothetical protein